MVAQIKSMVDSMLQFCEALEGVTDLGGLSVKKVMRMDLLKYALYLSASDGYVDEAEAAFIRDYYDWDMPPALWTKFIKENGIYSTSFENEVPLSLKIFVKADNNAYTKNPDAPNLCELYHGSFAHLGSLLIKSDGNVGNQEEEDLEIYLTMLQDYIDENSLRSTQSVSHEDVLIKKDAAPSIQKGITKKDALFLICPSCGKIIQNKGTYCPECYTDFDDMIFSQKNYREPISQIKYYNICATDKKDYKKIVFLTSSTGFVISPKTYDGYEEDYFCDKFSVQNGVIITEDPIMSDKYAKYGDFLYDPQTVYNSTIPNSNFFDAHCSFNQYVKPIWFLADGTVRMYDGNGADAKVSDEGRYLRDGNLIKTELTDKKSGAMRTQYWLVVNGSLCGDAYANDAGFEKIKDLSTKPIVSGSSTYSTITKEEFFKYYPCQFCNARQEWKETSWEYTSFGSILVSGRCRKCNGYFNECEEPEVIKRIAHRGSDRNPFYHAPAGSTHYLDNPCPYCGSYQVRYAKWQDKQMSAAFWGFFSPKLHSNYKCEKCGKMWE